jgi:hypothetical protein
MTVCAFLLNLLVALSLLASAATAHAECAWVLWAMFSGGKYIPVETFVTRMDCRKVELHVPRLWSPAEGGVCLPDTVDPRGPKGK